MSSSSLRVTQIEFDEIFVLYGNVHKCQKYHQFRINVQKKMMSC